MGEISDVIEETKKDFRKIDFTIINKNLGERVFDRYCSAATYPPLKSMNADLSDKDIFSEWNFVKNAPLNVYIHFPFCAQRCTFCHFNIKVSKDSTIYSDYVESLISEIGMYSNILKANKVSTVFIGGGTPSLMEMKDVDKILECLSDISPEVKSLDFLCMEIHPQEKLVETNYLKQLKDRGFNRVSIGVQDFNDDVLKATNRGHDRQVVIDVVNSAKKAELTINLDLLFPLPYQTLENMLFSLKQTVALAPDEITFNITSIRESMAIYKDIKKDHFPSVDECFQMNILIKKFLERNGYTETFPRKFEKFNPDRIAYDGNYFTSSTMAFGAGAYSTLPSLFYYNVPGTKEYMSTLSSKVLPYYKSIHLDVTEAVHREMVFFVRGGKINLSLLSQRYGVKVEELFKEQIQLLLDLRLATKEQDLLSLTELGTYFRDEISKLFVSENVINRMKTTSSFSNVDSHLNHFYEI